MGFNLLNNRNIQPNVYSIFSDNDEVSWVLPLANRHVTKLNFIFHVFFSLFEAFVSIFHSKWKRFCFAFICTLYWYVLCFEEKMTTVCWNGGCSRASFACPCRDSNMKQKRSLLFLSYFWTNLLLILQQQKWMKNATRRLLWDDNFDAIFNKSI